MSLPSNTVVVLVGPTASGKSAVALSLAALLHSEILSADSRQVYRYMDIGTAKPSPRDREVVPHHFVDILTPDQEFSAGEFGVRGREVIQQIFDRKRVPLVVGGSGLYVRSLIDGFFEGPSSDRAVRAELQEKLEKQGVDELVRMLAAVDPEMASTVDATKPRRIIRALEVYRLTGMSLSSLQKSKKVEIRFRTLCFGLSWDRESLNRRVERRCDEMLANGFLEEVEALVARGYTERLNALNTVGYAEAFRFRRGELNYEQMVSEFKKNSRRYAKRQMTWFRRDARITWIEMDETRSPEDVAGEIARRCGDRGSNLAVQ